MTETDTTKCRDTPAGRLQALVRRMVEELREFNPGSDSDTWALSQAAADDLELYILADSNQADSPAQSASPEHEWKDIGGVRICNKCNYGEYQAGGEWVPLPF